MEFEVSWQRKHSLVSLPQRSVQLVQKYHQFLQSQRKQTESLDTNTAPDSDELLKRAQQVISTCTSTRDDGAAEYRCLETGGFLLPTVSLHPCYKSLLSSSWKQSIGMGASCSLPCSSSSLDDAPPWFAVLDLACGLGADGRQVLVDGFATHVVGMDQRASYLRLGCQLFGDDEEICTLDMAHSGCSHDDADDEMTPGEFLPILFVVADVAATPCDGKDNDDDDAMVSSMQWILQKHLQRSQGLRALDNKKDAFKAVLPCFSAVYAGKFLHLLQTERRLRLVLHRLWRLLYHGGCLFGVFGRNYQPPFECSKKEDMKRVLVEEGFHVSLIAEEPNGATWFCAFKK